ncbi:MAG: hypothetical protein U9R25_19075 [Chloroflexota bacterium]|nr:hypothetical protein [Chloroflexota bacterium]
MAKSDDKVVYSSGDDDTPNPFAESLGLTPPKAEPAPTDRQTSRPSGAPVPSLQRDTPVRVFRDRKGRRGKTVCVITGVMSRTKGKKALLKKLKSQLGTGGTLKGDTIEIQGDHRERIVEILNGLGFKAKAAGG